MGGSWWIGDIRVARVSCRGVEEGGPRLAGSYHMRW